nr:hypothetical protein [Tanacetum cinerariifolium]
MTNFLFAKIKFGFVDGSIKKLESISKDYMAWMRYDAMVKGWLTTAMEKEIRTSVKYANTAAEIWKDLKERFGKESAPRAYELKQILNVTQQDRVTVSAYFMKLRRIWDEINTVLPTSRCTCNGCKCEVGKKLVELKQKERLYEFLLGLDSDFIVIRAQILAMKPTPSLSNSYHMMAKDEHQRNVTVRKKTTIKMAALQLIGYPNWWPGKAKKENFKPNAAFFDLVSSPIPGLTNEQYGMFLKLSGDCKKQNQEQQTPQANMAEVLGNVTTNENETPIAVANGIDVPVKGNGEVFLKGGIKINGVLFIPNFKCNLLSVRRLIRDLYCAITFFPDFFLMHGLRTRSLIGADNCINGLCRMGVLRRERKAMAVTSNMWHKRLGHSSNVKLSH